MGSKFSFRIPEGYENILLDDFTLIDNGVKFSATLNRQDKLGMVDIRCDSENIKTGVINIHYHYPKKLHELINNLILDVSIHFNSFLLK